MRFIGERKRTSGRKIAMLGIVVPGSLRVELFFVAHRYIFHPEA
jgi:hypothetical protein